MTDSNKRPTLTVSQLSRQARELLEDCFPAVWVEGEISGLSMPGSGHWYFTLKDDNAQIGCAMFRRQNIRVRTAVTNGMQVMIRGKISLFEPRGQFQLIVEHMEDAGLGALQRAFDALKAQLQAEGLFASSRKRPLPKLPAHVGIVTSTTGAAIHDIVTVLRRRFPAMRVTVFPTLVQGDAATRQIVAAIERANRFSGSLNPPLDVLIVGRGGGALEDLQAFNQESVARAIIASSLPVVSAVGHEVDITIADLVADARAPTPSAAAELISPDRSEWLSSLNYHYQRLLRLWQQQHSTRRQQLDWTGKRLRHPGEYVQEQRQRLAELSHRLRQTLRHSQQSRAQRLAALTARCRHQSPITPIRHVRQQLQQQQQRLLHTLRAQHRQRQWQLASQSLLLHSLSPLATLGRGYAIVKDNQQRILRSGKTLTAGDAISARLAHDTLHCTVNHIEPHKD
ncbi:MAG TPA: exodeoxyribonuclease VII large subunit [Pseudomonadales bacterium]